MTAMRSQSKPEFTKASSAGGISKIPLSYGKIGALVAAVEFALIIGLSAVSSAGYEYFSFDEFEHLKSFSSVGVACAMLYGLAMQSQGLYRPAVVLHPSRLTRSVLSTWALACGMWLVFAFLAKISLSFSRGAAVCFFVGGAIVLPTSRVLLKRLLAYLINNNMLADRRRVVLLGDAKQLSSRDLFRKLNAHGYSVVEQIGVHLSSNNNTSDFRQISDSIEKLNLYVRQNRVDEIFLVFNTQEQRVIDVAVDGLRAIPIPVRLLFDQRLSSLLSRRISDLGAAKAIKLQSGPLTTTQQMLKRVFDVVLSLAGIVFLAPIFVVIAIAIRADSSGPVLFRQRRAGFSGRPFRIYKFRSMTTMDDGAVVKQAIINDMRVTKVGRLLRKTSIDELPQLINVLRGEMSLVGPRPHAVSHDSEYNQLIATYALRHHMKPGITGWAQVNGCRGETSSLELMEQRIKHDLWYISHWSILLDITAVAMTVVQIVRPKNVY